MPIVWIYLINVKKVVSVIGIFLGLFSAELILFNTTFEYSEKISPPIEEYK